MYSSISGCDRTHMRGVMSRGVAMPRSGGVKVGAAAYRGHLMQRQREDEHLAQLEGYVHRYGPGMVVYWFGFAASLADPAASGDLSVVVAAEFPAEILFPAAEAATELPLRVRCS